MRPKPGGFVYHNNIVAVLKVHLSPLHIGEIVRLPGAVSPDMLSFASLQITLPVPEVVGTKNWVTSNLPFRLNPRSTDKMQS